MSALIQEKKPEKCMYCDNVELLVEVSTLKQTSKQGGVIEQTRKMCNQCFLDKVWNITRGT